MSNKIVVENLISTVRGYLEFLKSYSGLSRDSIVNDMTIRAAVERYLYLVVQSTIDLAEAIIAYKKFRKPATFAESFYILDEMHLITPVMREKMIKMTGFRNIIAHEYIKINYDILYDVLLNKLADIEEFLRTAEDLN